MNTSYFHWILDSADENVTTTELLAPQGNPARHMGKRCIKLGNIKGLLGEFLLYEKFIVIPKNPAM